MDEIIEPNEDLELAEDAVIYQPDGKTPIKKKKEYSDSVLKDSR